MSFLKVVNVSITHYVPHIFYPTHLSIGWKTEPANNLNNPVTVEMLVISSSLIASTLFQITSYRKQKLQLSGNNWPTSGRRIPQPLNKSDNSEQLRLMLTHISNLWRYNVTVAFHIVNWPCVKLLPRLAFRGAVEAALLLPDWILSHFWENKKPSERF